MISHSAVEYVKRFSFIQFLQTSQISQLIFI